MAAGLKACLLFMAKTYFDATAINPARNKKRRSLTDPKGEIMEAKIKMVIYVDSLFDGALNMYANNSLVAIQTINRHIKDKTRFIGL